MGCILFSVCPFCFSLKSYFALKNCPAYVCLPMDNRSRCDGQLVALRWTNGRIVMDNRSYDEGRMVVS